MDRTRGARMQQLLSPLPQRGNNSFRVTAVDSISVGQKTLPHLTHREMIDTVYTVLPM